MTHLTRIIEELMMRVDEVSRCDVARGIPTGDLWRSITHDHWVTARINMRNALRDTLINEFNETLELAGRKCRELGNKGIDYFNWEQFEQAILSMKEPISTKEDK